MDASRPGRRSQAAGENRIEEAASAPGDERDVQRVGRAGNPFGERLDERGMEERGTETRIGFVGEPRIERREDELVTRCDRKKIALWLNRAVPLGEAFEQHRRLTLEG